MTTQHLPDGGKFAFTIIDHPDTVPVSSVRAVYDLLDEFGFRITRAVWSFGGSDGVKTDVRGSLDDEENVEFLLDLQSKGHEICWAGASRGANRRERTIEGLERFREVFGHYPRLFVNSATNRESLYWGSERIDQPLLKAVAQRADPTPIGYYQGHVNNSAFWWGDICQQHIDYVLHLTFEELNVARINPGLPYHDPLRPCVRWWFSGTEVEDGAEFNQMLRPDRMARLTREAGCCIISTKLSRGYLRDAQGERLTRRRLDALVKGEGWFAPASRVLDHYRQRGGGGVLPESEWDAMQRKFTRDLVRRRSRDSARGDAVDRGAVVR